MKGLENLLKQTGRYLATTISALALYSSAQEPVKIEVAKDGSWEKTSDATLYFQSTTGSQGRDLTKSKANQFKTPIYFSGRKNSNNNIEFFYATTDWNNPSKNPPVPDNVHSKLYLIADSDTEAEIVSQKIAILNSKGEITFEDATPKEKASSTLMKIGLDILEAADKGVRAYVQLKTAGIVNIGIEEALTDYCENKTRKGASDAKNNTGYELSVNNLPLWVRDTNLAFRNREVGRITEIKIKSPKEEQVSVSIYSSLTLKRETEQERGKIEAFTELFTTPARKGESQTYSKSETDRHPLHGIWKNGYTGSPAIIDEQGNSASVPIQYVENSFIDIFRMDSDKEGSVGTMNENGGKIRLEYNENKTFKIIDKNTIRISINGTESTWTRYNLNPEKVMRDTEKYLEARRKK